METELQLVLKSLKSDQREQLMTAFNQETDTFVEYEEGKFIGVNCGQATMLEITETRGVWSIGRIKKGGVA